MTFTTSSQKLGSMRTILKIVPFASIDRAAIISFSLVNRRGKMKDRSVTRLRTSAFHSISSHE